MLFFLMTLTCEAMLVGAVAPEVTVQSLDGDLIAGKIVDWTNDAVVVDGENGRREIPFAELGKIAFSPSPAPTSIQAPAEVGFQVQLVDRSELNVRSFLVQGDEARVVWDSGEAQPIPLSLIRSVSLVAGDDRLEAAWKRLRDKPRRGDRLAVRKGEEIDYVEGVVSQVTKDHVEFDLDGELIPVKWSKLAGVLFADRRSIRMDPSKCQLTMHSGTEIPLAAWKSMPEGLAVQLPCGLMLDIGYQQLRSIDFSQDKVIYLSKMKPLIAEWSPYLAAGKLSPLLARFYGPRQDRSSDLAEEVASDRLEIVTLAQQDQANESGGPPSIESYAAGLSLQSKSRLVYELPPEARRFETRVGIDAGTIEIGNVYFEVRGDGRLLYGEEISGSTGPRDVSVDVTGLQRIELIVDYGKNQDTGDRLNLCNARIVK